MSTRQPYAKLANFNCQELTVTEKLYNCNYNYNCKCNYKLKTTVTLTVLKFL